MGTVEVLQVEGHTLLGVPGTSHVQNYGSNFTDPKTGRKFHLLIAMHVTNFELQIIEIQNIFNGNIRTGVQRPLRGPIFGKDPYTIVTLWYTTFEHHTNLGSV